MRRWRVGLFCMRECGRGGCGECARRWGTRVEVLGDGCRRQACGLAQGTGQRQALSAPTNANWCHGALGALAL